MGLGDGERRTCRRCGLDLPLQSFRSSPSKPTPQRICRRCEREEQRVRDEARRQRRLASDYIPLRPEDYDVTIANDGRTTSSVAREKRQEWSEAMGEYAEDVRAAAETLAPSPDDMRPESGTYIGRLAEQERRFGNRRTARSLSLLAAHEELWMAQVRRAAEELFRDKVLPSGYATRVPQHGQKRTVVLHLSDLHIGAELAGHDEPVPYGAVEEARRLEYVVRQALDYKPQYRDQTRLVLLLNGDLIEGLLLHDLRSGAPLTEQKCAFWKYFQVIIGLFAQQFPSVLVVGRPGNHGRDRLRHPGRATSSKWDGHEWQMLWALREMCAGLPNVTWDVGRQPVALVDLHGAALGVAHGDTEPWVGHPLSDADRNASVLSAINAERRYGQEVAVWTFGHWHRGVHVPGVPEVVYNGALLPPNGHARSQRRAPSPCCQVLWESVEGFPVGDVRWLRVGVEQDRDERLGVLIQPFRLP